MNQTKGHPKGLYLLFVTEMWERFSYYGMRALFMLYMVQALLFDKETASQVYGSYTGLVYLTPLIGGYIADRYWGNRRSIVVGALTMALGQFLLFLSACYFHEVALAKYLMFCGLGLLILGNGSSSQISRPWWDGSTHPTTTARTRPSPFFIWV